MPHVVDVESEDAQYTALHLLNPDNRGQVSATERVRTIGEEVSLTDNTTVTPAKFLASVHVSIL